MNYALRILKPVLDGKASAADLKIEAERRYVNRIQSDLQKTVWFSGCQSWYVRDGEGGKKWNAMSYPWSQGHFWYRSLFPTWSDWSFSVCMHLLKSTCSSQILTLAPGANGIKGCHQNRKINEEREPTRKDAGDLTPEFEVVARQALQRRMRSSSQARTAFVSQLRNY